MADLIMEEFGDLSKDHLRLALQREARMLLDGDIKKCVIRNTGKSLFRQRIKGDILGPWLPLFPLPHFLHIVRGSSTRKYPRRGEAGER